jgi:hypothetical protein
MKTLTLLLLLALPIACTRPPPVDPPAATLPANVVVVATVARSTNGPLVRDPKGRFATHYWRSGMLHVPEGIDPAKLAELLEVGE